MRYRKIFGNSARLGLLLVAAMAAGPVRAQNQTPANAPVPPPPPPPAWRAVAWKDPDTGLMWAKRDNGSDVNQNQAVEYCRNLNLAGFRDWRLPETDELAGLYDPSVAQRLPDYEVHVRGGIQMTGYWFWSAGEERPLNFTNGKWDSAHNVGYVRRALCVRRSGEGDGARASVPAAAR
jgi:hypothetical protein